MQLYLIRHTRPALASSICYGQSDIDVADSFAADSLGLLTQLHAVNADAVFTSPALRCQRLADSLSPANWHSDHRLLELNFGAWELKSWDNIPRTELDYWSEDYVNRAPPGGESFQQLAERVRDWLEQLQQLHAGQTLLVITHAGVIRALLAHALQLPLVNSFKLSLDYGCISQLHLNQYGWQIACINRSI